VGGQQRAEPREEDQVAAAARRVDDPDLCAGGEERLCRVEALHQADSEAEHPHASRVPPPVLRPNRRDVRVLTDR